MQKWQRFAWCSFGLFQVVIILIATAKPANAYVDPGSGLLFLQIGGSMLVGALFVLRDKLRKLFRLGPPKSADLVEVDTETSVADEAGTGINA